MIATTINQKVTLGREAGANEAPGARYPRVRTLRLTTPSERKARLGLTTMIMIGDLSISGREAMGRDGDHRTGRD